MEMSARHVRQGKTEANVKDNKRRWKRHLQSLALSLRPGLPDGTCHTATVGDGIVVLK